MLKTVLSALMALLLSAPVNAQYSLNAETQAKVNDYGLTVRNPGALEHSYANSPVPLSDYYAGNYNLETHAEMAHERAMRDLNNSGYNITTLETIRAGMIAKAADPDVFNALVGYHEIVPPSASLVSSVATTKANVRRYTLSGRYGQPIDVYCGIQEERSGLVVLLAGRGGSVKGMWGFQSLDYSNNVAKYYFDNLNMNVCTVRTYVLPDLPIKRYGLNARSVDATQVIDFLEWGIGFMSLEGEPVIVGGISNGAAIAEMVSVIDDRVDVLLSIGGAARYDTPFSQYADINLAPSSVWLQDLPYTGGDFLFRGEEIFALRAPKPLIISIGTHDAGQAVTSPYRDKFDQIKAMQDLYASMSATNCFEYNLFLGGHASDPIGEVAKINALLTNCP